MVGHQFFAHASNKNFGSLDDMNQNDFLNQAVEVGRIDRLIQIAIFG